jgi:hypothetical protein
MKTQADYKEELARILNSNDVSLKKAVFLFDKTNSEEQILFKFNLWAKLYLPKYFTSPDAPFHQEIDKYNLKCYREEFTFVDVAFRGAAKSARTKLFLAYCIANDLEHFRKYIKILSTDIKNAHQIVTDIYNIFVLPEIKEMYPEIFQKTITKREETMSSFTTSTGIKMLALPLGVEQRGALQEESRPDLIWNEDFESRVTLRSAVKTKAIWDNMEEARTSLAQGGSCLYTCNYVSESGNVHKLITKKADNKKVLIVPIIDDKGVITWNRYTKEEIEQMKKNDDDFEGERLCKPSASKDVYFDRESLEKQILIKPLKIVSGLKIFKEPESLHKYASGHDIGGGVGFDSSTTVVIDFSAMPAEVVAVYADNITKPDLFAYEIQKQIKDYNNCLCAPEVNNYGNATLAILKQLKLNLYKRIQTNEEVIKNRPPADYGWETNALTKPKMLSELADAIIKGLLIINDEDLFNEIKGYTRNDLLETVNDPRLTTRHFDLLIALAICWQMKTYRFMSNQVQTKIIKPQIIRDV